MNEQPGPGTPPAPPAATPAPPPPPPPSPSGVTPGGWAPGPDGAQVPWGTPQTGGNGCLRACLVIGLIGLALVIVGVAALAVLGGRLVENVRDNPDAFLGAPCTLASPYDVSDAVGEEVQIYKLEGFLGGMMHTFLDKRLLPDAPDCYVIGRTGLVARIAVDDTGGPAEFADARAAADGRFLNTDLHDIGDEAFCTAASQYGSAGALVRWGQTVAYVSVGARGGMDADGACTVAKEIARTLEP